MRWIFSNPGFTFERRFGILLRIIAVFGLSLSSFVLAGDDLLVIKNGDRLLGKIKNLDQGILHFETDYGEKTFEIDWEKVEKLESTEIFVLVLSNGDRFTGHLQSDPENLQKVIIMEEIDQWPVNLSDLVYIKSVKETFRDRLSATVDFGYTLTKANKAQQLNLKGSVGYLTKRWFGAVNFSSVRSTQKEAPKSRSADADINYRLFLTREWFGIVATTFRSSDEQRLDLRSSAQAGGGRYFIQTNRLYFMMVIGGAWTNEKFQDPDVPQTSSLEGLGFTEFNAFDIGALDVLAKLSVYPSLTQSERVRLVFSSDLKWKLPLDFFFKLSYTHNYDSAPPNDASKSDFTFTTSFGWEL
jgi:putative salt-induced outer membrane protein YdiY